MELEQVFCRGTGFGSKLGLGSGLFIGLDDLLISFFEILFIKSCKYFKSYKFLAPVSIFSSNG
nr:hypothetical protein [Mycoplasmopsis bovis]